MAPKRKAKVNAAPASMPNVLSKETLDDLGYIEPKRSRDRVVAALNELFLRVMQLEHMHANE